MNISAGADGRDSGHSELLSEQSEYYRQRAPEYEDWWYRRGRYDQGEQANAQWLAEVGRLEGALREFAPSGRVLELACGTGLWTRQLVCHANHVSALDGSQEMIALNRARIGEANVEYLKTDLFRWQPKERYDVCFFSFWLSHVPQSLFAEFWEKLSRSLLPGGRVFFIDSARGDRHQADRSLSAQGAGETMSRTLADGREFQIIKRFYQPEALQLELSALGFEGKVQSTGEHFIHATVAPVER